MKNKIYYLSTCDTCKRIIQETGISPEHFLFQDIKTEPITSAQLEEMRTLSGSYEALFSKIARKYRLLNLHTQTLSEEDYKKYILEEYTFLKRPVVLINGHIFIGNSKSVITSLKNALQK
ncbi:MAG: ArsC/Spx/MgsR family protein [Sediminibacterium sp.]|nr:ArsC/Spx/MgsR family protein [Sediminibacterium sp.]